MNLESNIWKYTLLLVFNKRAYRSILGAFFLTIPNVTVQSIGVILLVENIASFLFEIPSGYLADRVGHKEALVVSRVFLLLSTILFAFSSNVLMLIFAGILLSIGDAFMSGTLSAFMHDTIRAMGREKEFAAITGKAQSIGFIIPIALTVTIPFLIPISYRLPFIIVAIGDIVGLVAALLMVKPPVELEEIKEIGVLNFRTALKDAWGYHFIPFALFGGVIGGFFDAVDGFRAAYQVFLDIPVAWYGVFFGISRLLTAYLLAKSGYIRSKLTLRLLCLLEVVAYGSIFLGLSLISNPYIVVTLFVLNISLYRGLAAVTSSYMLDIISRSKMKATLLSIEAQLSAFVAACAGISIGYLSEALSFRSAFLITAIVFISIQSVLLVYIWRYGDQEGIQVTRV
ncbi:MAG: MFS transporter [bacterium]|nr:MFS transporter [bacterium]